jgi:hypothetical protein
MQYLLTGIETHPDFGFGITAEAYRASANLLSDHKAQILSFQQAEMPINFLYRHSIELFIKSLIIIMHKALKIPYGEKSFDSEKPMIIINEEWKDLFSCHWIDDLYVYWLEHLLIKNADQLSRIAPNGDWLEEKTITNLLPIITKYDRDTSFFRYPITKSTQSLDKEKYTMQPLSKESLAGMPFSIPVPKGNTKKGGVYLLCKDENDQVVRGYQKNDDILTEVNDALHRVSEYLSCIHIMSRCTLCNGH